MMMMMMVVVVVAEQPFSPLALPSKLSWECDLYLALPLF